MTSNAQYPGDIPAVLLAGRDSIAREQSLEKTIVS